MPAKSTTTTTTNPGDTKPAAKNAVETFVVRSPVEHDGEHYEIDDVIELTKKQAAELLACGAVEAA